MPTSIWCEQDAPGPKTKSDIKIIFTFHQCLYFDFISMLILFSFFFRRVLLFLIYYTSRLETVDLKDSGFHSFLKQCDYSQWSVLLTPLSKKPVKLSDVTEIQDFGLFDEIIATNEEGKQQNYCKSPPNHWQYIMGTDT